ncbi:MAG: hypothetical protein WCZ18_00900 [Ottowia sp.]
MKDDLAGASMTAPLRGGNDGGCAAMMGRQTACSLDAQRWTPNHHRPPQAAIIQGPQGPRSSVIRRS